MEIVTAFQSQVYRSLPAVERADAIVHRLKTSIALGLLHIGERLPSEAAMSELFGVSPATVREALATLRDEGIAETRRGRNGGTFITARPEQGLAPLRDWLDRKSIAELRDIGDEHSAIAAATVRLACERAEAQEIERLGDRGRDILLAETPEARATADSRFHIELAIAAQSPRLTNAEIRLQAELGQVLWAPLGPAMDPETAATEHLALVHAISSGPSDRAQDIVLKHIRRNTHHLIDTKLVLRYGPTPEEARP